MSIALSASGLALLVAPACSSFSEAPGTLEDASTTGDDANADDATRVNDASVAVDADSSTPTCGPGSDARACGDRYIFVTAGVLKGDFAADAGAPTAVADAFCADEANRASSPPMLHGRSWHAWLCTSEISAEGHAATTSARWIRPDGTELFSTLDALREGTPKNPISAQARVWTGCNEDGTSGAGCMNWTSTIGSGPYGRSDSLTRTWSNVGDQECQSASPIYCLEYDP